MKTYKKRHTVQVALFKPGMEDKILYYIPMFGLFDKQECLDSGFTPDFEKDKVYAIESPTGKQYVTEGKHYIVTESNGTRHAMKADTLHDTYELDTPKNDIAAICAVCEGMTQEIFEGYTCARCRIIILEKCLMLQRDKEEKKVTMNVVVFGASRASTLEQFEKLLFSSNNKVEYTFRGGFRDVFETSEVRVEALVYTDSFRGLRLDEVYVDKNLSIGDLDNIKLMRKSNHTPIHYF